MRTTKCSSKICLVVLLIDALFFFDSAIGPGAEGSESGDHNNKLWAGIKKKIFGRVIKYHVSRKAKDTEVDEKAHVRGAESKYVKIV